jgi:hypothetical protein
VSRKQRKIDCDVGLNKCFLDFRCEVCKAFTPEWAKVGQEISDDKKKIQVADFDCHKNKKSCDELWVESYPTFMWIDEGESFRGVV